MNTSLSWIKQYVPDLDVTAQEYTDAMTLSGTKVEGFERLDEDLEDENFALDEELDLAEDEAEAKEYDELEKASEKEAEEPVEV